MSVYKESKQPGENQTSSLGAELGTMRLPSGCFGGSKIRGEPTQPRSLRTDRPPPAFCQADCANTPGSDPQVCGCHRRGAIRRKSRDHSSRRSSILVQSEGAAGAQQDGHRSNDGQTPKCNDQQRELDTEKNRRLPKRKPVPLGIWDNSQVLQDPEITSTGANKAGQGSNFVGLSIARAVSPLNLDDIRFDEPSFPPSPITPEGERKDHAPWS
jgi:hypothetical protein